MQDARTPKLRPMGEKDVDGVMAVERQVYPFPWTAGIFRDCMRVGYSCWVWEHEDRVVGYGVMSTGAGEAHILNLAVHPTLQRRGLGRGMIEHLLRIASQRGADEVFLEVRPSNQTAVRLYEEIGFSQVGIRRGYYPAPDGREDALIMARRVSF